ncbi:MAG: hypothetical protein ACI8ZX_002521 [Planctomycetota bacterium]|jgi:hypothetical protein
MILLDIYSTGLWITYALIALAIVGMVFGITLAILQNLKEGGLVAIISTVILLVLFGIGYAMSASDVPAGLQQYVGESGYQLSSGGLITFYIMAAIATILMVVGLVKGIFEGN